MPAKSNYAVTVTIFKEEISVPYTAKEKYFDSTDKLLGENVLRGTWNGVSTFVGSAKIEQSPLESDSSHHKE